MSFQNLVRLSLPDYDERLNDPGHSILVRKSYNFARYLNLTFTDLENIAKENAENIAKENAHFICNSKDHSNGDIMISIDAS
jgi:hypothetical protein